MAIVCSLPPRKIHAPFFPLIVCIPTARLEQGIEILQLFTTLSISFIEALDSNRRQIFSQPEVPIKTIIRSALPMHLDYSRKAFSILQAAQFLWHSILRCPYRSSNQKIPLIRYLTCKKVVLPRRTILERVYIIISYYKFTVLASIIHFQNYYVSQFTKPVIHIFAKGRCVCLFL